MSYSRNPIRRFRELKSSMNEDGFSLFEVVLMVCIMVALSVGIFVTFNGIAKSAEEAKAKAELEESGGTPTPSAAPEVAPVSDPPDFSGLWMVAGGIGAALGLAVLVALLVFVIRRSRRAELELTEKRRAIEEERNQALAVWQKSVDRHSWLSAKAYEVESDWDMLFSYPTLADSSVPQTREFHRAMRVADAMSSVAPAELNLSMDIPGLPYPKAVDSAHEAWASAWSFAQRTGTALIPREERKKLDQILQLLKIARDSGGSEHERNVAYERAEKLIGTLRYVQVPEAALKAITSDARLMIEAPVGSSVSSISAEPVALKVGA